MKVVITQLVGMVRFVVEESSKNLGGTSICPTGVKLGQVVMFFFFFMENKWK